LIRATADTPPAASVPAMGDHMTANTLYGGIVTALYRRQRTGQGGMVGTSLMGNGLWSNGLYVQAALDGADMNARLDAESLSAFTNIYRCRDDRWFMLTILLQAQEKSWPQLARCAGHEEWIDDPRFIDIEQRQQNNAALKALLDAAFAERDWQDWRKTFADYGITCGGISQAVDHCEDEQARAAGMLTEFDDGSGDRTVDSPLFVHGESKRTPSRPAALGEHSRAIMEEFGLDADTASEILAAGPSGP
jgi:crotonobetainyl-CoA:carnitine CoA-transferase CaiB-like acyl-CoA transferase